MKTLKIFHIDCGRKYFNAKELSHIIEELGRNKYDMIELAISNGGMRFLLDDMEVITSFGTYSSDEVKEAIHFGNKQYCDCGVNELDEAEMEKLYDLADDNNIKLLPLLNSPGHMEALVSAMEKLGIKDVRYKGSRSTLDFDNKEAVEFTKAFITKYIKWFSDRRVPYFNMGCDEYANDVLSSGFEALCNENDFRYDKFIQYANELAKIIINYRMKPVMFNDGMYYNETLDGGRLNPEIICSYWTVGWPGYTPASAIFIENQGHKIINTADAWYYVLGRRENTVNPVMFTDEAAKNGIKSLDKMDVLGGSINLPIGAMLCLWCDEPEVAYSPEEVYIVDQLITLFGDRKSEVDEAVDAIQLMMDQMDKKTFGSFVDIEREGSLDNTL